MTNLLQYLLEVNVYLALAYGGYWLLLRRQTFHCANRVYLLASALLCFAIPLVQISVAAPEAPPVTQVLVQEVFTENLQATASAPQPQAVFEPFKALTALYITGTILGFVLLSAKLYKLLKLIFTSRKQKRDGYTLVLVPQTPSPFSFMGYLFVADEKQLQPVILKHELVHITQKHSYDVLFTELLKIACWFNPAVYLLQTSLKTIHEFEADRLTAGKTEQDGYVDFLIAQACHNNGLAFANHFSEKNLLKSRIMKLYQKRSGSLARLNYLMALPLCAGMLSASSLAFSKDYGLKLELGKTPEKNLTSESITNYASENKNSSPETNFPAPTVRSDDGKVSSNAAGEFKSIIEPTRTSAKKDSVKKLRLKVTSGNTSTITDQLQLDGASGKKLVYTAQNLTAQDKKELKQKFGIEVETTTALASKTSIIVMPPPPPSAPRNPGKIKHPLLLPPPPPVEKPASQKNKADVPPPPPPVEGGLEQKNLTPDEQAKIKQGGRVVTLSFQDLLQHVNKTMRYPTEAKKNNITGALLTSFRVDENREISDVAIKYGTNATLDAEAEKALSSYKGKVIAKPGVYTIRLNFKLQNADGTIAQTFGNKADLETPTAGEITVTSYSEKD